MDTVKVLKGYGKVEEDKHNHLEDQHQHERHNQHRKASIAVTVSIFVILFLTLALAFAVATVVHRTTAESPQQQHPLNSADSIRAVCNVTRFPDSCIAAVSSSAQRPTDPRSILSLSLRASVDALASLSSSLGAKASGSNGQALADCKDQVDDALSRLNDSLSAIASVPSGAAGVTLTDEKISDIQTWVSAAVTDQQTCLDGLEEVGSVAVEEVKNMMKRSSEYVSNSLAIVANIRTLSQQFHTPLH